MTAAGAGSSPLAGRTPEKRPLAPNNHGGNHGSHSEPPVATRFSMAGKSQQRSGGLALRQKSLLCFFGKQQPSSSPQENAATASTPSHGRAHLPSSPLAAVRSGSPGLATPTKLQVGDGERRTSAPLRSERPVCPKFALDKADLAEGSGAAEMEDEDGWGTSREIKFRKRARYSENFSDEDHNYLRTGRSQKTQASRSKERDTIGDAFVPGHEIDEDAALENDVPIDDLDNECTPRRMSTASAPTHAKTPSSTQSMSRLRLQSFSAPRKACEQIRTLPSPFAAQERKKERIKEFNDKNAKRYQWLQDIRDADGNRPGEPEYDPRTLHIPKSAWAEFSPFEKQFWEIKSTHWDTVVFFKKGKFYELYENDADIGHQAFDLKLTDRVNMRMVGIPESSFDNWASQFIAQGHKVAKVEQLETALAKSLREKEAGGKTEQIIRRELTAVLTGGTLVDESLLQTEQATYCMAIKEIQRGIGEGPTYGICFVDTATGEFSMCEINDDVDRTGLETLLVQVKPRELVYEKRGLAAQTMKLIKNNVTSPIMNALSPEKEFWDAERTLEELRSQKYFAGKMSDAENVDMSTTFMAGIAEVMERPSVMSALGGLISYLRSLKLDEDIVSLRNFHVYDPVKKATSLILDGPTLVNLEVFANSHDGTDAGSVYKLLDRCITPFGKRLFKRWLCHPLRSIKDINRRLDAIEALNGMIGVEELLSETFRRLPDMERIITRVHAGTCKLKDFLAVLEAFETASSAIRDILGPHVASYVSSISSTHSANQDNRLFFLVSEFPDVTDTVAWFRAAFDWKLALKMGTVVPHPGIEDDYDEINERVTKAEKNLADYLTEQRKVLHCPKADYRHLGKDLFQLEVPSTIKVPKDWTVMSSTKTAKRYYNSTLRKLVQDLKEPEELKKGVLKEIKGRIYAKFDEYYSTWLECVKILAEVDCLMSLAKSSSQIGEPCCRPEFLEPVEGESNQLHFEELRHPCIVETTSDFIPNDVTLGGDTPNIILLTGPNMGGKSTLLRQTCVGIIMAQLGTYVPAKSCRLTPFDRIFTRIGANDNILAGQSTFMVELTETSKILQEASPQSMVILDELGRGTSTFDGYSIAYAVLHYLSTRVGCLGLFSTHYGNLTAEFDRCPNVRLMHMDCQVDTKKREVTFLYRLTDGVCPKSYGMNVASMAGVPRSIVEHAEQVAHDFEKKLAIRSKSYAADRRLDLLDLSNFAYIIRCLDTASSLNRAEAVATARVLKSLLKG